MKKFAILCIVLLGIIGLSLFKPATVIKLADPAIGMFIDPSHNFTNTHFQTADPAIGMSLENNKSI
ncbi:hypothetical protein HNO13_15530 [Bacillus velezensis]|uniref:hypothetical protein n=1 Tax=Bacillus amyloliquefaciens group TaxID=1938374 RepID=UPI0009F59155|nr:MULTISPECIES: hypothetical protein [Bacillus amyloliquefaciens group]MBW8603103.1 hypothetical protein [Bacillus amyloliquefaciens]MEE3674343.1 hypothetical protein [Bacillus velezensis]OQV40025.1 hypothetical protein B5M57_13965 [Bacillus velezensis]QBK81060.1 hypothetical protein EYS44_15640 [Bacillus velezensis]QJW64187.1 hypothetical protein HNO12_15520 [Bacillus amyloliquefaciens]